MQMQPQSVPPVPSVEIQKATHNFIKSDDVWEIVDTFSLDDKEKLIQYIFKQLPIDRKVKLISKELGVFVVVDRSKSSISSEICRQIESACHLEIPDILEAIVRKRQRDRK